jgi:phosphohistidine phosphatase SixA
MRGVRSSLLCALLMLVSVTAPSQAASSRNDWVNDLRWGGYVIVFRHGATTADQETDAMNDPKADLTGNPAAGKSERQLNDVGRAQARAIGAALRKLGIPVGMVLTSPLQRAVDTGMLMAFGEVTVVPDLAETGPVLSPEENGRRAQALRTLAAMPPPADTNMVIVSHAANIVDAFGRPWSDVGEGEASVFEPDGQGSFRLVVRVPAGEWARLSSVAD